MKSGYHLIDLPQKNEEVNGGSATTSHPPLKTSPPVPKSDAQRIGGGTNNLTFDNHQHWAHPDSLPVRNIAE